MEPIQFLLHFCASQGHSDKGEAEERKEIPTGTEYASFSLGAHAQVPCVSDLVQQGYYKIPVLILDLPPCQIDVRHQPNTGHNSYY